MSSSRGAFNCIIGKSYVNINTMSQNPEIKYLLHKFILNQCNPEEIDQVVDYYKKNQLTEDFPTVEDIQNLLGELPEMDKETANTIFASIVENSNQVKVVALKKNNTNYKKYIGIAASFVVLATVGLAYIIKPEKAIVNAPILNGNEITLQMENGEVQVLTETGQAAVRDAKGSVVGNKKGNTIIYDAATGLEKLVYNTIRIPNGKRFQLQLSDGTLVHLNAGTTLKYPVKFIAGESRKVFLDGEAFFDVAKDAKHPFTVNADNLNVRVLGTHFNVSSYPEDDYTDVVLVEGSVAMQRAEENFDLTKSTVLVPGFKGSFNKDNKSVKVKAVNTNMYTSWINGGLVFRNMAFKNIIKKLERRYNVTIINRNVLLANEKFNASFKDEPIEKVLGYFNDAYGITYTVKNNFIIIK